MSRLRWRFFSSYCGSGETIYALARLQVTSSAGSTFSTVVRLTCLVVMPRSQHTAAIKSKVQVERDFPNCQRSPCSSVTRSVSSSGWT
ncbi:MAG: hypothetical protein NW224_06480 [Leptolyngbyaceae cyanobacterium bins.302]|nr:hypothetical protein [Leptolyngbyaceae cyanobacterium bins.302]